MEKRGEGEGSDWVQGDQFRETRGRGEERGGERREERGEGMEVRDGGGEISADDVLNKSTFSMEREIDLARIRLFSLVCARERPN